VNRPCIRGDAKLAWWPSTEAALAWRRLSKYPRNRRHGKNARSYRLKRGGARCRRRACSDHVIDDDNVCACELSRARCKCAGNLLHALRLVGTHLMRGEMAPLEPEGQTAKPSLSRNRGGQKRGLIVTALHDAPGRRRDGHENASAWRVREREPFGKRQREGLGELGPIRILEPVNGVGHGPAVCESADDTVASFGKRHRIARQASNRVGTIGAPEPRWPDGFIASGTFARNDEINETPNEIREHAKLSGAGYGELRANGDGSAYKSNPSNLLIETSSAGVNGYWSNSAL